MYLLYIIYIVYNQVYHTTNKTTLKTILFSFYNDSMHRIPYKDYENYKYTGNVTYNMTCPNYI